MSRRGTSETAGRWEDRGRAQAYFETVPVNCALCGKIIPRRAWVAPGPRSLEMLFCDPDCERVYREYWLPKYGRE